jgi:hypothetical protein
MRTFFMDAKYIPREVPFLAWCRRWQRSNLAMSVERHKMDSSAEMPSI